jgi:hypothetical protein
MEDSLLINFKWSKTIQDHSRILSIPLVSMPSTPLCPVAAYSNLLSLVKIPSTSSAFSYKYHSKIVTLSSPRVVSSLRLILRSLGFDSSKFSGHSFRRSGATWAFRSGVQSEAIKSHGDWRSLAYLNYIQITTQQKQIVSRQMASQLSSVLAPK